MVLDRAQRDALYQFVLTDLVGVGDVALAIQAGRVIEAQRLRLCFEQDLRLLDLLGWQRVEDRDSYELTLSDEAAGALLRLRATARELIADSVVELAGDVLGEAVKVVEACSTALRDVGT
jgi:uncharacterized protein YbjQ (UPF0145 family)